MPDTLIIGSQTSFENEVQRPMAALVTALAAELARRGVPLTGDPKRSIFRLHRDLPENSLGRPRLVNEIADFAESALPLLL